MTRDKSKCSSLTLKSKEFLSYGDNIKERFLGIVKVGTPPFTTIDGVIYVEGA